MNKATNSEAARDTMYGKSWMRFEAWDAGNCEFWLDSDGEVAAYIRFDDSDDSGISFFEVRDSGNGIGSALIAELREEKPELYISGDIDSAACARFWHRNGFDVDGCELSNGRIWNA